jgi:hypothetical protein
MSTVGWLFDLKIEKTKDNLWFGLFENLEVQELLEFIVFGV